MSDWCVLRTAGRTTLKLAETLAEDGFEVWTPAETKTLRIPRANVRRQITLPIMPSYLFARVKHLVDLLELAAMPVKPRRVRNQPSHADFSVMHYHDTIPLIAERHLEGLRTIEAKRAPRKKSARLPAGVSVKVKTEGGSFAGMEGKVERSDETYSLVCFSDRIRVKISTSLLQSDDIRVYSSEFSAIRKAA